MSLIYTQPKTLLVCLPWPVSTNHTWRKKKDGMHLNAKVKNFRLGVASAVASLPLEVQKSLPITREIRLLVGLAPPLGKDRRRDQDNFAGKTLLDAVTKAGLWEDDSLIIDTRTLWLDPVPYGQVKLLIKIMGRIEGYGQLEWDKIVLNVLHEGE